MNFQFAGMMADVLKGALDSGLWRCGFASEDQAQWFCFFCGPVIHMSSTGNAEAGLSGQPPAVRKCALLLTPRLGRVFELCSRNFGESVIKDVEMFLINDLDRQIAGDAGEVIGA